MTWTWVWPPLAVLAAAIITGLFGVKNARKAPHDTLRSLAETLDKTRDDLPTQDEAVLRTAIDREIRRIDLLNQAENKSRRAYIWVEIKQFDPLQVTAVFVAVVLLLGIAVVVGLTTRNDANDAAGFCKQISTPNPGSPLISSGGVANTTRGDTTYLSQVSSRVDDVLKFELTYRKGAGAPAVNDLTPLIETSIDGKDATITGQITTADGTFLKASAAIQLSVPDAQMTYIAGSTRWCDNTLAGQLPTTIADGIVSSQPQPLTNLTQDDAAVGTVTALFRVTAKSIAVRLEAKTKQTDEWSTNCVAAPGEPVRLRLVMENRGSAVLRGITTRIELPGELEVQRGTTVLTDREESQTAVLPETLSQAEGVNAGEIPIGKAIAVETTVAANPSVNRGSVLMPKGVARPLGMDEYYNTVSIQFE